MELIVFALMMAAASILLLGITRLILQLTKPSELLDRELQRRYRRYGRG